MKNLIRGVMSAALLVACVTSSPAADMPRSFGSQALLTGVAVIANVTPGVSTFYAPRCLPGYIFCKAIFAAVSVIAAGDQLALSGGGDMAQTRAILHRGFGGDWLITPRHIAREVSPEPLPEPPPPPTGENEGGWEPPPL